MSWFIVRRSNQRLSVLSLLLFFMQWVQIEKFAIGFGVALGYFEDLLDDCAICYGDYLRFLNRRRVTIICLLAIIYDYTRIIIKMLMKNHSKLSCSPKWT